MSFFDNDPFFSGGFGGGFGGIGGMMNQMRQFHAQADAMFDAMSRDFGSHRSSIARDSGNFARRDSRPAWGSNTRAPQVLKLPRCERDIAPVPRNALALRAGDGSKTTRGSCAKAGILPVLRNDEEKIDTRARARMYDAQRRGLVNPNAAHKGADAKTNRTLPKGVAGVKHSRTPRVEVLKTPRVNTQRSNSSKSRSHASSPKAVAESVPSESHATEADLKPFTDGESRLIDIIESDIIDRDLGITWQKIAKLDEAKRLLKEAVVLPLLMPELFTGLREPWKGILLYGPPGTGKTLLAKAVSTECKTTFFNVSASTLVSRWHGESEKMVKTLFGMARHYAPSVIFLDEIDALMMSRGGSGESDATRRLKVEMLQQMDGVHNDDGGIVMVLATTNKPWDLDDALRRRLEKRIYIPLPDAETREEAFNIHLSTADLAEPQENKAETKEEGEDVEEFTTAGALKAARDEAEEENRRKLCQVLASKTEGYTGSDIKLICREAAMMPMRRLMESNDPLEIAAMKAKGELESKLRLDVEDFDEAIKRTSSSVDVDVLDQYTAWTEEFASA